MGSVNELTAIAELRAELWRCGYRPVPLLSASDPDKKRAGKSPTGKYWIEDALRDPPRAAAEPALRHLMNTGIILTGHAGPVAVDVDVDDAVRAEAAEELLVQHLGAGLTRRRCNSARFAVVFGSDPGDPPRGRVLRGAFGRIEVLSDRHQLAAYGQHVTGAELLWPLAGPLDVALWHLPQIGAAQVGRFLAASAPIIGAALPDEAVGFSGSVTGAERVPPDLALLASAMAAIPVADMEYSGWIRLGAALWHTTAGGADGLALWDAWSQRSGHYNAAGLRRRWASFAAARSGAEAGARTLLWLARRAGWRPPPPAPDAAWEALHPPVGEVPSAPPLRSAA